MSTLTVHPVPDPARPPRFTKPKGMLIELHRWTIPEGLAFLAPNTRPAHRTIAGHLIAPPKGRDVFLRDFRGDRPNEGFGLTCSCGLSSTHMAAVRHSNNVGGAFVMNLFADTVLMTQDHIVPKSLNGSHHVDNMRVMCETCNRKRGNHVTLDDWLHGALYPNAVVDTPPLRSSLQDLILDAQRLVVGHGSMQSMG